MAKSINQAILLGNLTRDCEVKNTQSGAAVTQFDVALDDSYKGKDGNWHDSTEFITVRIWNSGKVADYLKKGTKVAVQGKIRTQSWEQDNVKKYKTYVQAAPGGVTLCSSPPQQQSQQPSFSDDDVPF